MRYSLEPHYRRYVQGQGFMSFARNIGNKYGRKIFDKNLDVGKSMKKKYGKKILDNVLSAGKDFELNDDANLNNFANNNVVSSNSFQYKNQIIGNTYNVNSTRVPAGGGAREDNLDYIANNSGKKSIELAIPLTYLDNFWRALNMPLISCEVSLELKWDKYCVITSQQVGINLDGRNTAAPMGATFGINDKLYVNYMYQ